VRVENLQALLGIGVFILIAWGLSERRDRFDWRVIAAGLGLQVGLALLLLYVPAIQTGLSAINGAVGAITHATEAGATFVFGYLAAEPGATAYPFAVTDGGATYLLAFRVLPLILIFTVVSGILWQLRILPWIIRGFSFVLERSMGVSGAVGVATAANIFLGMVEAPVMVRPYLERLSRSELFMIMTCGMATVAGSVMLLYSVLLQATLDNALAHILTASVISAPAALMLARIMVPPDGFEDFADPVSIPSPYASVMDALTRTTTDGVRLMVNVGAMLLVLVTLVTLVNVALGELPHPGGQAISLERIFGVAFAPVAWLMGIPAHECLTAGSLLGTKLVLNEIFAYFALADAALSSHSRLIMTYALCGFANFASLGIMIGGLVGIMPARRDEIVSLAPRTLISGTLATCMTGCLAGILSF
jgi:CNT family concentrative nucleoside transporter